MNRQSLHSTPRRVLHVVGSMARGGIETWLMHVLRRTDPARYHMDFLVRTTEPQAYDDEVRRLGGRMIACTGHRIPWEYARNFGQIMREYGPYDVIHSHMYYFNGTVLRLASRHGVPVRVAHSHNDYRRRELERAWHWRWYWALMRAWIRRYSTCRLAVSRDAADALFGPGGAEIVRCGLDLAPFARREDPAHVRRSIGIPGDALVIGHVGRFAEQKNHAFLVRIAAEVMRAEPRARLVLVGDGPLRSDVERQVRELGMADRVLFAGVRQDVPRLMTAAMDVFVMPSHHEGLSVALVEAQAAGLPCVVAEGLTREGDIVPALIRRISLDAPADAWLEAVQSALKVRPVSREDAWTAVKSSAFDIDRSILELFDIYERELEQRTGLAAAA